MSPLFRFVMVVLVIVAAAFWVTLFVFNRAVEAFR